MTFFVPPVMFKAIAFLQAGKLKGDFFFCAVKTVKGGSERERKGGCQRFGVC